MNPAMIATWTFGILLVLTPGVIDWRAGLVAHEAVLRAGHDGVSIRAWPSGGAASWRTATACRERFYRIANEVPTLLMIIIVIMVIVKPF